MHEIKIYGEIISVYAKDNGQKGYSLSDLQNALKEAGGKEIKVRINSVGGDVAEGFAMYDELRRYAKENKVKVHTYAEAQLASIATVPFLAGDTRTVSRTIEPFVHNAWMESAGDSATMRQNADELERCNDKIARHYSEHTDLTYKEARSLMDGETNITSKEALRMRFATNIEKISRPAAMKRFNNSNLNNDMNKNPKTNAVMAAAKALMKVLSGAKNKLVMTADEVELDFYELEEDEVIEVGANVRIDGDDSVTADYVMKSGETYKIVDGVLAEIVEAGGEDTSEDAVALQAEIDALTSQLEAITNKAVELEATNKRQSVIISNLKKVGSQKATDDKGKEREQEIESKKGASAKLAIAGFINKKPLTK